MGEEARRGRAGRISEALESAIHQRLAAREQSLLFLNRRGFSNFLFCPSCKWVARCDDDDVALTFHKRRSPLPAPTGENDLFADLEKAGADDGFLKCHFCGTTRPAPTLCPACGAGDLLAVGAGTQRIEEELRGMFPEARILRLDYDTTGGREGFLQAWKKMVEGDVDIILGTQMIAKGLHLEKVTLVGVVLADVGLFLPDFRAEERAFSLLTQVAGRAGRAGAGEAILQTYLPRHASIRYATAHDYTGFFTDEIRRRRSLNFPPFTRMAAMTLTSVDREKALEGARILISILWRVRSRRECERAVVNGPGPAPLARLAGKWRFRILARTPTPRGLAALIRFALEDREYRLPSGVRLSVDVDPIDLL